MDSIGITDLDWFEALRKRTPTPHLVNFWTPTPWKFSQLLEGDKWYFMLKAPIRKLGGCGLVSSYEVMPISEAWHRFGVANGVASLEELQYRTRKYAAQRAKAEVTGDHEIGCIILRDPEFWAEEDFKTPEDFLGTAVPNQVVTFKHVQAPERAPRQDRPWTTEELTAAVEAYLEMDRLERRGERYQKASFYRALSEKFDRTAKAFEYRAQNISYVLDLLGQPWIAGLRPAANVGTNVIQQIQGVLEGLGVLDEGGDAAFAAEKDRELSRKSPRIRPTGVQAPGTSDYTVKRYLRDVNVVVWVLEQAKGHCEACGSEAPFTSRQAQPFLEVHHVLPLGRGGPDAVENAVAVCPNCHRAFHHSIDRERLVEEIYQRVARLRRPESA